jgi:hypothetical protein
MPAPTNTGVESMKWTVKLEDIDYNMCMVLEKSSIKYRTFVNLIDLELAVYGPSANFVM